MGIKYLAHALQQNKVLQDDLFFFFIHLFVHCFIQTLTTLNLAYNQIGAVGAQHLANALYKNQVS